MLGKAFRKLIGNSSADSRVMIQCRTVVQRDAVRRESIEGVEHIIVSSATLPDDVVMNGGLYPASEIEKSFMALERTLAPVEHPINADGKFISANDPDAIHGFHAGASNRNVRRENGRVLVDKYINVAEAMKTERGKRLLDRIDELETSDDPRAIHTSVAAYLIPEKLDAPQTNAAGDEYTWIARNLLIDHDAILLDSVAAAQPHQGVGIAVNKEGEKCDVKAFELAAQKTSQSGEPTDEEKARVGTYLIRLRGNQSVSELRQAVDDALERSAIDSDWIEELFDDRVVFWSKEALFEVPFTVDANDVVTIVGIPLPVERTVTFTPKTNRSEGDAMKELIINTLKEAGIETEGLSDEQLVSKYSALQANQDDIGKDDVATVVANAVTEATKPLVEKIDGLEAKVNSADEAELNRLAELIGNSDKFAGLDVEAAKKLGIDTLKGMAASCEPAFGVSPVINAGNTDESFQAPAEMPN